MPFAIVQISVANLDLNSTNTMESRCHTTKIFRFRGTTFKTLTNLGRILQTLLSQTLDQPKIDCKNSEVQRCKPKKILNKITISFFLTFSTLHLCTLQIFTIFGCSGSVDCKNSHDLPSPLPPQNNARITLHACSTLQLEGQHCLVGVRGREHEP